MVAGTPRLPEARDSDCLGGGALLPSFEAEAVVGAVRRDGRLTGRVGDLGFGLTKPVGDRSSAAGFLIDEAAGFVVVGAGFSAGFAVSLAGLLGDFASRGDFAALEAVLADVVIGAAGLRAGLPAAAGVVFGLSFGSATPLRPLDAPLTADLIVGSAGVSLVLLSSSSTILSGFGQGVISGVWLLPLDGDCLAGEDWRGDSGIVSLARFVLNEATLVAMLSVNTSFFSDAGPGVVVSVSLLNLLLETDTESVLFCRWSPMRPSFSTAMKFVRTLDKGREEGVGEPDDGQGLS